MALIEVENLQKSFSRPVRRAGRLGALRGLLAREYVTMEAVAGVSFTLEAGAMAGYLGPNGAGKSTTMKMLTGILVPSGGRIEVGGLVPHRQRVAHVRRIGVVFGQRTQLWWDLPTIESFELLRHVYKIPMARYRENLKAFSELLELGPFLDTPVRQLSLGQRMRADLAAALLHDPAILFLDEPTIGLDVVARERIRGFLSEINRERGVTVILTTHDLSDVERLCQRVVLIDHGRVIYDGGLDQLKTRHGRWRTLVVDLADASCAPLVEMADLVRQEGPRAWLRFDRERTSAAALIAEVAARYPVRDLTVEEPEIEAIVRGIYERGVGVI
ncbi:ABC transporter ATP-binding protein [Oscillochloris sp. ZM17-4]|uniref:ABC transporter ATP-binding protein n=1 Tax=Oscillochloris sp. ZM17-4 TaxID=2866714 RepID=UPI001C72ED7A|nr:ABC transporter ATP-binding protein [Oscillochloris sp. ZM17-4]MBX0326973.1 ABC transporter ATP-binding protein [Oscillochloris sp. ZM17-4]